MTDDTLKTLEQKAAILETTMKEKPDNPQSLYEYCLIQRDLGKTEKVLPYLKRLSSHKSWFEGRSHSAATGVLGFLGLAVLLNQVDQELEKYFIQQGQTVGESLRWADVRLTVPFALVLKRQEQAERSAEVLLQCIRGGIAPQDVPVSVNEQISPIVLLLAIYKDLGLEDEMYQFIGEMPALLESTGLDMENVFGVVHAQDTALFEYVFDLLKRKQSGK